MSELNTSKRESYKDTSFLGTTNKQSEIVFDYKVEESESSALESVFEELFSKVRKQFDDIDK